MPRTFTTLRDIGITAFCSGMHDHEDVEAQLTRSLATGSVLPQWCWLAWDEPGRIAARHNWWGRTGSPLPMGVDLLSAEDHDAAVALILYARDHLNVQEARSEITAPIERGDNPSEILASLVAVLDDSGFSFEVARVTVQWTGRTLPRTASHRLTFVPARQLDDDVLIALFVAVSTDSLDNAMIVDRARLGADEEAGRRLEAVRSYRGEPDWFSVGFTAEDEAVGYVVPGLAGDLPIIGEVGVAVEHRGQGYVDDLLSWGTDVLVAAGAERIAADTDRVNTPMRAAFHRAGYRESHWRDDYRWRRHQG
jgi:RimJ/RimL family protein N-acetyltransferase